MDDNKDLRLWLALEKLTQIDNEAALFQESQIILSEIFSTVVLIYYKIHIKRNVHHQKSNPTLHKPVLISISNYFDKDTETIPLSDDPHLNSCYLENKNMKYDSDDENNTIFIFPLSYDKETQYLLKVIFRKSDVLSTPNLLNFFNIFINYYRVIRSNERDFLTGMYNRRAFNRVMNSMEVHPVYKSSDKSDYLIIIDIDFFKAINDNFGHMIGDEVLILFSRILRENIRALDIAFRTGGEEFVIITSDLTFKDVTMACERLRSIIEKTVFPQIHKLTISAGFTKLEYPLDTYYVLKKADCALYYAKDHGRNKVFCYETLVEEEKIAPVSHFKEIMDVW